MAPPAPAWRAEPPAGNRLFVQPNHTTNSAEFPKPRRLTRCLCWLVSCIRPFSDFIISGSNKKSRPARYILTHMLIGYARVSIADQTLDLQKDALQQAGCTKIFTDTASGAKAERTSITENIDTTTSGGKLVFHIFGALAEFERDIIRERTQAGLTAARARGRKGGRPKALTPKKAQMAQALYKDKNNTIDEICKTLNISRATIYRYVRLDHDVKREL